MDRSVLLRRTRATTAVPRHRASYGEHLVTVALGTWLMVGLFVDGWAHNSLDTALETFFTPWHALFYSGFAACGAWLLWLLRRGHARGFRGAAVVPHGYGLGLAGLVLFAVGGLGDMTWHVVFGIEVGIDALFSPTHLVLFAGIILILGSPFRDAWSAPGPEAPRLRAFLPPLLSLTLVVSLLAFFFMYWSPFMAWAPTRQAEAYIAAAPDDYVGALTAFHIEDGVSSALVTTLLLVGPLLLVLRRWQPPFGTASVLFTVPAVLSSALGAFGQLALVLPALVAGLVTDGLVRWLRPTADRRAATTAVAAVAPAVLVGGWFAALSLTDGVWYPVEVWSGTIVWAGLTGTGLALLAVPRPFPARAEAADIPAARPRTD